jgi:Bacterial PH domain
VAESIQANGRTFQFVTTVQASLAARDLLNARHSRVDLIVYTAAVLLGLAWAAAGIPFGLLIAIIAAIGLASRRFQPIERLLITRNARSLLGKRTEVTIDADGLQFSNAVATTYVPWSSLTAVRSNARTVLFTIDRVIAGYIPASAFSSPGEQADVVRFAQERMASESRVSRG